MLSLRSVLETVMTPPPANVNHVAKDVAKSQSMGQWAVALVGGTTESSGRKFRMKNEK